MKHPICLKWKWRRDSKTWIERIGWWHLRAKIYKCIQWQNCIFYLYSYFLGLGWRQMRSTLTYIQKGTKANFLMHLLSFHLMNVPKSKCAYKQWIKLIYYNLFRVFWMNYILSLDLVDKYQDLGIRISY